MPAEVDEHMIIRDWLKSKRGADVVLKVPHRGKHKELLDMAAENATETLTHLRAQWASDETKQTEALTELQQALDLPDAPVRLSVLTSVPCRAPTPSARWWSLAKACPAKAIIAASKSKPCRVRTILPA
jgi:excinuclease UvrABC nuclease subunit